MTIKPLQLLGIILVAFLFGIWAGKWVWGTTVTVHETAQMAVALPAGKASPHGSMILPREPSRPAKAAQAIPRGYKVRRVAQATIKPVSKTAKGECAPVTVDMTLADAPKGDGERVVVSSPDGDVIGGFDVPQEAIEMPANRPWAAGVSYGSDSTYGGWVDRDIGRLRVGVQVDQMRDGGIGARASIGFTFGG